MTRDMNRYQGCLLGLAVGDAVGTSVEFKRRGSFPKVTDMLGGGTFQLAPGQWTDDTSMALCLATSLVETQAFDLLDQMQRYIRWWKTGYLSSNGRCFDVGLTVSEAFRRFEASGDPLSGPTRVNSAGNGSLMRLAPVPLAYAPDREKAMQYAGESSRTTNGAAECVDACQLFASMLVSALAGADKTSILLDNPLEKISSEKILTIAGGYYRKKSVDQIQSGGYVVESLEAALWCFWRTDSYAEAILEAANLGEDADTTAAICGQLAGAFYGRDGIPAGWLEKLTMRQEISELADRLAALN